MKKIKFLVNASLILMSSSVFAQWTGPLNLRSVEVHESGVYLIATINGLSVTGCSASRTYNYVHFPSSNDKLADRALSSTYYAQSVGKNIKANIKSCNGDYAVASGIMVENK